MPQHISTAYDDDLLLISGKLTEMGGICEEMLNKSLQAILKNQSDLAQSIIQTDEKVDELENEIEELIIRTIALRQPVANDLRVVFSAIKISTSLERIGDLTKNIAKRTLLISDEHPLRLRQPIYNLGTRVHQQLTKALNAQSERNSELAREIWYEDYQIDEIYSMLLDELLEYLKKKKQVNVGSHLMFVAKNLERIGDHTTLISEMVHFVITGQSIGEDRPKISI